MSMPPAIDDPAASRDVLVEVDELISALESHPDIAVRTQVAALLERIDAVHRVALTHLMDAIRSMGGEAFINRLTSDVAVRLLLMSYDLVAVDRRIQTEEALDAVRGHLHRHDVHIELLDVVGGVIYARLHGLGKSELELEAVRHDLEEALRAGLLGFQELVLGDRQVGRVPPTLVQLGGARTLQRPVYHDLIAAEALAPGTMRAVDVNGTAILVVNVDSEYYALANHCGDTPLPLHFSTLNGAELRCSWHGCEYDVRSGKRLDRDGDRLTVFPVVASDGVVRVALGVEPAPAG